MYLSLEAKVKYYEILFKKKKTKNHNFSHKLQILFTSWNFYLKHLNVRRRLNHRLYNSRIKYKDFQYFYVYTYNLNYGNEVTRPKPDKNSKCSH